MPDSHPRDRGDASRRAQAFVAGALGVVYLAVMSGHLSSMDGLYMYRQAYALVFDHAVQFQTPVWNWTPQPVWNSTYGIGLSLLYVPGMLIAGVLRSQVPMSVDIPTELWAFYLRELYQDPLYTVGASWMHALVVAVAAYLVARLITELRGSHRAAFWGMAFYGLGSSAFVYARGDFSQPLEGLCWAGAALAAVRFRKNGERRALVGCMGALGYAILTRPVEGMLLLPAVLVLAVPTDHSSGSRTWAMRGVKPVLALGSTAVASVAVTLLINWMRFGDALTFGYADNNVWTIPDVTRWAGALVSPGRGLLWEFPAIVLAPLGALVLVRSGRRREALAILMLCGALFANTVSWYMWWGGVCWGLRLFSPALPLMATLAGAGVDRLQGWTRSWLPGILLVFGFAWALPGVLTDILGGYADLSDDTNIWRFDAYPPVGAWRFLERMRPDSLTDAGAVDILWFRLAEQTGNWSLLAPIVLLVIAAVLIACSRRSAQSTGRVASAVRQERAS